MMMSQRQNTLVKPFSFPSLSGIITHSKGTSKPVRYLKGALLGKGAFAKCYKFTNLDTKLEYAAKTTAEQYILVPFLTSRIIND